MKEPIGLGAISAWRLEVRLHSTARKGARVVPPAPITVAIDDETTGEPLGFGVLADLSESGASVWTNRPLVSGSRVRFRVSFRRPAEVQEVEGRVVWECPAGGVPGLRRAGIEWRDPSSPCLVRLRQAALSALDESLTPPSGLRRLTRSELEG